MRWLLCGLMLAAVCGPAAAQDIQPRLLLVFDTSGSMGIDVRTGEFTFGDNSAEYPGSGGESRLFVAKNVIASVVETTSEVGFALMRYPQIEGAGINDGLGRGAFNSYEGLGQRPLNYAGYCGGTLARRDADTPFSLLVPFGEDNELEILSWLDHHESFPADKELRAEGPTPIAESLRLSAEYYRQVLAADPVLRCRRNYVILLTDGGESCVEPAAERQRVLLDRTLALRELQVGGVRKDVRTYVVAFGVEPAEINLLNTVARVGGTAVGRDGRVDLINGQAYQAVDQAGLRSAFARILADAIVQEDCNGEDDDCDGRVDEGVLNACGQCGAPPAEACDGDDDDCDGLVDEGVRNACGGCGALPVEICNDVDDDCDGAVDEQVVNACGGCAAVRPEVCNNVDDDCDGVVDNDGGDPLRRPCGMDVGECRSGSERCERGDWVACDGVLPVAEVCNGRDDDCDGLSDEVTRPCGPAAHIGDVGQCRVGRQVCCAEGGADCDAEGWSTACPDAVGPGEEVCDGLDNDCDGAPDEGLFNACGQCGDEQPEACNGVDDNCDGRVDEDAACPPGHLCFYGECVQPCDASGECNGDYTCVAVHPGLRVCHPDACAGAACPSGTSCDAAARACVDPCRGVVCPDGEGCDLGECVAATCRHAGCPDGRLCRGEACVPDPCLGVTCGPDGFCRDGACHAACRERHCGPGSVCRDGECAPDPCGGRCLRGQRCDALDGACVEDACARVTCPTGMACVEGACRADGPCAGIACPVGTACVDGTCTDSTPGVEPDLDGPQRPTPDGGPPPADAAPDPDMAFPTLDAGPRADGGAPPAEERTAAADGCDCDAGGGPGSLAGLWLLGLLRRRRRA